MILDTFLESRYSAAYSPLPAPYPYRAKAVKLVMRNCGYTSIAPSGVRGCDSLGFGPSGPRTGGKSGGGGGGRGTRDERRREKGKGKREKGEATRRLLGEEKKDFWGWLLL
jgi:hypothetical protein